MRTPQLARISLLASVLNSATSTFSWVLLALATISPFGPGDGARPQKVVVLNSPDSADPVEQTNGVRLAPA